MRLCVYVICTVHEARLGPRYRSSSLLLCMLGGAPMVSARTTVAAAHRALHNAPRQTRAVPPDAPCPLPPTHPRSLSRALLRLLLLSLIPIAGHERAQAKLHTPPVRHEPAMPVPIGLLATHVTDLSKFTSSLAHAPPLSSHNLTILHAHALHAHFAHTRRLRPATRRLRPAFRLRPPIQLRLANISLQHSNCATRQCQPQKANTQQEHNTTKHTAAHTKRYPAFIR
jgi:hypothetical protein